MKIGLSSRLLPQYDVKELVRLAKICGFEGIELGGIAGGDEPCNNPALIEAPEKARDFLRAEGIKPVVLSTNATVSSGNASRRHAQKELIEQTIELGAALGASFVRFPAGGVEALDTKDRTRSRVAREAIELAKKAATCGVGLLIENTYDFATSPDIWFIADAVSKPAFGCCWNQRIAKLRGERPTNSMPRLARKIGVVHLCDGLLDEDSSVREYTPLGQGDFEVDRQLKLLKGLAYDGWLVYGQDKPLTGDAAEHLKQASQYLKGFLAQEEPVLAAYKGDKNPAKFASRKAAT